MFGVPPPTSVDSRSPQVRRSVAVLHGGSRGCNSDSQQRLPDLVQRGIPGGHRPVRRGSAIESLEADAVSLAYEGTSPPHAIAPHRGIGRSHEVPRDEPIATADGRFDAACMDDQPSTPPTFERPPTEPNCTGGPNPDECARGESNGLGGDRVSQRLLLALTPQQQDNSDRNPCNHNDGDPGTRRHAVQPTPANAL
jgi:hypothetical protein